MSNDVKPEVVRAHLVAALEADLIGPFEPSTAEGQRELLKFAPSRWYLTGFLAPQGEEEPKEAPEDDTDNFVEDGDKAYQDEVETAEPEPKRKKRFPQSVGLSVLVPETARDLRATITWADYAVEREEKSDARRRHRWRRVPRGPVKISVPLNAEHLEGGVEVPGSDGLYIEGRLQPTHGLDHLVPKGTQAVSIFLVNRRSQGFGLLDEPDSRYAFQVQLALHCDAGFVPRPNRRGAAALKGSDETAGDDWDERVVELQFRSRLDYAVGHGISTSVGVVETGKVCDVRTTWIPAHEVRPITYRDIPSVELGMDALANMSSGKDVVGALSALPKAYANWIGEKQAEDLHKRHSETRKELLQRCTQARERMEAGLRILVEDPQALQAFKLANRAMAMAARQRSGTTAPTWRPFQLAFVLLNIRGITDPSHNDRQVVDLIFFPTGGGKTEAYLGVIAFSLALRRLRGQNEPHGGRGVAIVLRYTLRLLTLDQLGRAATLICALEKLRREDAASLGNARLAVGLWVGRAATANTLKDADQDIQRFREDESKSPFPLAQCPWCKGDITPRSLSYDKANGKIVVGCTNLKCDFSRAKSADGLPVLYVDEQIYTELPAFIVATVDKFAMLPMRGEIGMLFGHVRGLQGEVFIGNHEPRTKLSGKLPQGLPPPDIIVQDELHLISGPLGTMIGLYESAIGALCTRPNEKGGGLLPKIITSTATVRRAEMQTQSLFGRDQTALFPPAGIDEGDTFFSTVGTGSGRLYVGLAASCRAHKSLLLRTYITLLAAAAKYHGQDSADGYQTLAGYFNSLRELGGMRRLVEDEVHSQVGTRYKRCPEGAETERWYGQKRKVGEPLELTSRVSTSDIALARKRLECAATQDDSVDVLLASNMISVGIDIARLGLMVVAGQPKTASEYIQASSRVGRNKWPGLVVTCYNVQKARDRSYFEHFAAYHGSLYRHVEAASVTPFSSRALDRGLVGVIVSMMRFLIPNMAPAEAAASIAEYDTLREGVIADLARRAATQSPPKERGDNIEETLPTRLNSIVDSWRRVALQAEKDGAVLAYSRFDRLKGSKPLLEPSGEPTTTATDAEKFRAPTSMREVEGVSHVWLWK